MMKTDIDPNTWKDYMMSKIKRIRKNLQCEETNERRVK